MTPSPVRRSLVLLLGVALVVAACSGDSDGSIRFELEPIPAQPWIATGDPVDAGAMCREGSRRNAGLFALDGTPTTWEELIVQAQVEGKPLEEMRIRSLQEWTCADGSGTITMLEDSGGISVVQGRGEDTSWWRIEGGTGAYAGMTGEGTFTYELAPPPAAPGEPPEGELVRVWATGTVSLPARGD